MVLRAIFDKFSADFLRIYRILPTRLKRATLRVFACVAVQAVIEVCGILAISFLAISIAAPDRLFSLKPVSFFFDMFPAMQTLKDDPRQFSLLAAGLVTCAIAAKNGMFAVVNLMTSRLGERIALFAGEVLFHHYLYSPYTRHLAGDSNAMFQGLAWRKPLAGVMTQLLSVYTYAAITLALSITLVCFTPTSILLTMLFLGGVAAIVYKSLKRSMEQAGRNAAEWGKQENKVTLNAMRGIRETLIYQQQEVFFKNFQQACRDGVRDRAFLQLAPPIPTWILETSGFLAIFTTLLIMCKIQDASMVQITAVLTLIMLTAWRILPLLNRSLGMLIAMRGSRHPAMECLIRLEDALAHPAPFLPEPDPDFVFRENIVLRDVFFAYSKKEEEKPSGDNNDDSAAPLSAKQEEEAYCLRGINFSILRGSRVGVIGQSGAGKSTLAIILSGLVEPTRGELLVDGRGLAPAELVAYRRQVGFVPQNPYIMGGTVAENVTFSQWGKSWDEEKVMRACQMAEFDVALQRGINASLGQDGAGLSGGQAQRLSIARALYAEPSILIFDEATSALDSGVEKAIMNTIFSLPRGITTITIAHRLSTVERCDTLFWLDGGSLVANGSPHEILPRYQEFLNSRAMRSEAAT